VDASADVLYGPNPLQKSGTVTVPRGLLREIGVEIGDDVHWMLNPDIPGTLVLIPAAMVSRTMPDLVKLLRQVAQ
jgi:hypothetical protein